MKWLDFWRQRSARIASNQPHCGTHTVSSATATYAPCSHFSTSALPGNLRRLREARGWSVTTLANESAVSISAIRRLEHNTGLVDCELTTVLKLANAFGVTPDALVRERGR